jgi:hypothetical protein
MLHIIKIHAIFPCILNILHKIFQIKLVDLNARAPVRKNSDIVPVLVSAPFTLTLPLLFSPLIFQQQRI